MAKEAVLRDMVSTQNEWLGIIHMNSSQLAEFESKIGFH